jgi:hypothetical protein
MKNTDWYKLILLLSMIASLILILLKAGGKI